MGKKKTDNVNRPAVRPKLNKLDVKTKIKKIVEKRRAEIGKIIARDRDSRVTTRSGSSTTSGNNSSSSKPYNLIWWIVLGAITIFSIICFFGLFIYGLITERKSFLLIGFFELMFAGIYVIVTYFIHDKVFGGTLNDKVFGDNVKNTSVLLALIPLVLARGLMISYPTLSKPFDNTIGYFWLSTFYTKQFEVMNSFESRLFPSDMLAEFDNKIPFGWLLTTFDLEHVEQSIDQLKKQQSTVPGSIVTDFYINEALDIDDVKYRLRELVEMKRVIGHCSAIFIACAFGLAFSIAQAVPLEVT
jgi:hypothetical protein